VNTNNGVKWRRFIVPKKVEQTNDHLFIDTYKYSSLTGDTIQVDLQYSDQSAIHIPQCDASHILDEEHRAGVLLSLLYSHADNCSQHTLHYKITYII